MNSNESPYAPEGDIISSIPIDNGDEVCDIQFVSGNQFITELQAQVAFHERQLRVWKAALNAALHPQAYDLKGKAAAGTKKPKARVSEVGPSPYIMGLVSALGMDGIKSSEIREQAVKSGMSFANDVGFPYKQLNRLKRTGKVRSDAGRYFKVD